MQYAQNVINEDNQRLFVTLNSQNTNRLLKSHFHLKYKFIKPQI